VRSHGRCVRVVLHFNADVADNVRGNQQEDSLEEVVDLYDVVWLVYVSKERWDLDYYLYVSEDTIGISGTGTTTRVPAFQGGWTSNENHAFIF
jgi:hypothetical protein